MNEGDQQLQQGWKLHQAGRPADAEKIYRELLESEPGNANGWCFLGLAFQDQGRHEEAIAAYHRALKLSPRFTIALNNLGNTYQSLCRFSEAIACFDSALEIEPDYVNALKNKGTALTWAGRLEAAEECYGEGLVLAPDDPELHKNLGIIRLLQGRFAEGWSGYEWRWRTGEMGSQDLATPRWDGQSLEGKTILLTAEQGFGDTIQFVRYAAVLKNRYDDCRVVVACQNELLPLLGSFQGADLVVDRAIRPFPEHDCFCPLLSVPAVIEEREETIPGDGPYLGVDEKLVVEWGKRLSPYQGFRIGVVWQGNPKHQADRRRSFSLGELGPLATLSGVDLFSLQKGEGKNQIDLQKGHVEVTDLGAELETFTETAAVLRNLDLLVTADTAIAHLAGALGAPVWLALPKVPDWRWLLEREDTPWYPGMRLIRQHEAGNWADVFERIAEELLEKNPERIKRKEPEEYCLAASGFSRLVSARHGFLLYNRHDQYVGRSLETYGEYSEKEVEVFNQLIPEGSTIIEAGANIGAHTLALAKRIGSRGRLHAFEPQRIPFQNLCANMALNGLSNVECLHKALGENSGSIVVPNVDYDKENNFGGLELGSFSEGERVSVTTIDALELPKLAFLKVDVEGMERQVILGGRETIARCRPVLYLENDRKENSASLIELVMSLGYDLYWHLPPLFNPGNHYHNPRNVFGGIVSVNLLCIPTSAKSNIRGLRRVEGPDSDWREKTR